jgi:hypothetical protein
MTEKDPPAPPPTIPAPAVPCTGTDEEIDEEIDVPRLNQIIAGLKNPA